MNTVSIPRDGNYLLNLLPLTFDALEVRGETLVYVDGDHLRRLQDANTGCWVVKRAGKILQAVPLVSEAITLAGNPATFLVSKDWSLFEKLAEEGVRRLLKALYPSCIVSDYGEVILKTTEDSTNVVKDALKDSPHLLAKVSPLKIFRTYHFEAAHLRVNQNDPPIFGLRLKPSTSWEFDLSIAELANMGIPLLGCYVVPLSHTHSGIGNKTVGAIKEIKGGKMYLSDARDTEVVDTQKYTIEASSENVSHYLSVRLGGGADNALRAIRREVGQFLGAAGQQTRIAKIAESFTKQPIVCAHHLSASIGLQLQKADAQGPCQSAKLDPPKYVLKFNKSPVTGPVATAIDGQGPFDQDSFKKPIPYILIVTPKRWMGQVDQFIGRLLDGGLPSPYAKGLIQKYRLRGYDKHFEDFEESGSSLATMYEQACLKALQFSREHIKRYDLALVVTSERHRKLGADDPYLVAKSTLMNQGISVQSLEIETINSPVNSWPFILNNLALACYAKLGGTPWVLASPKGTGITHEVVVGPHFAP